MAGKLEMEEDEQPVYMALLHEYKGYMLFAFENGKFAKWMWSGRHQNQPQEALECLFRQVTLGGGYVYSGGYEVVLCSDSGRKLLLNTGGVLAKSTKDTIGISAMTLKKNKKVTSMYLYKEGEFEKPWRYRAKNLPAAGALPWRRTLASS